MRYLYFFLFLTITLSVSAQQLQTFYLQGDAINAEYITHWDYDEDSDADLVVGTSNRIRLYTNNGSGDFERLIPSHPIERLAFSDNRGVFPEMVDMDGDGDQDLFLIIAKQIEGGSFFDLTPLFKYYRNDEGEFIESTEFVQHLQNLGYGGIPTFTLYDWDEDDDIEAIVSLPMGGILYLENINDQLLPTIPEDNPFGDINTETTSIRTQALVVNPDEDDDQDILYIDGRLSTTRYYENNAGLLTLQPDSENPYAILNGFTHHATIADFTGDGEQDVWVINDRSQRHAETIFLKGSSDGLKFENGINNPFSNPEEMASEALLPLTQHIALADFNGNGSPELYAQKGSEILAFDEQGKQITSPFAAINALNLSIVSFELFDWDNDNDMDLFIGESTSGTNFRYFRNDAGTFNEVSGAENPVEGINLTELSADLTFADFNGDDFPDLAISFFKNSPASDEEAIYYYQNDQNGHLIELTGEDNLFKEASILEIGNNQSTKVEAGDINGDGKVDLLIGGPDNGGFAGAMRLMLNRGDNTYRMLKRFEGTFGQSKWSNFRFTPEFYDIDHDNDLDIFATNQGGSVVMIENITPSVLSINDQLLYDGEAYDFELVSIADGATITLQVSSNNPSFDVASVSFDPTLASASKEGEFTFGDLDKSDPHNILIPVTFLPQSINQFTQARLLIHYTDGQTSSIGFIGMGKGSQIHLYEDLGPNLFRLVQSDEAAFITTRESTGSTHTIDLFIQNTGNETLEINTSSLELPDGVTLSTLTPLPETPPTGLNFEKIGTKLTFNINLEDAIIEPYLTEAVLFESNDSRNNPFFFQFLFLDIEGLSSPALLSVANQRLATNSNPITISSFTNSSKPVTYEIVSGEDLVELNDGVVTIKGKSGVAVLKASVPDDPSTETLTQDYFFYYTIVDDINHEVQDMVIKFDDISVKENATPFFLRAFSSASFFNSITYEIISGSDIIKLDGPSNARVLVLKPGMAEVKVSYETNASGFNSKASATAMVTILQGGEDQSITFNPIEDQKFGVADFDLVATASSGLDVEFTLVSGPAELTDKTLSITGAGEVVITANQLGDDTYGGATPITRSFQVLKGDQTITITPVDDKIVSDDPFDIMASVDTGLPLTYEVSGPVELFDRTLTLSGQTGSVSITVSQAGNENYVSTSSATSFEVRNGEVLSLGPNQKKTLIFKPNPANDWIKIEGLKNTKTSIQLFDMNGQRVLNTIITFDQKISLEELPSGLYTLMISQEDYTTTTKILIEK